MRYLFILSLVSLFFISNSYAQSSYTSTEEVKRAALEKQEEFQRLVENSVRNQQLVNERGRKINDPEQKADANEALSSGAEKQFLYVELWTPRQAWLDLSQEERREFFNQVGGEIQALTSEGIQIVGFALNGQETAHRSDFQYIAVWQMPSQEHVEMLEESVSQAGWYEYFEQENASGELISPTAALADMVQLK